LLFSRKARKDLLPATESRFGLQNQASQKPGRAREDGNPFTGLFAAFACFLLCGLCVNPCLLLFSRKAHEIHKAKCFNPIPQRAITNRSALPPGKLSI